MTQITCLMTIIQIIKIKKVKDFDSSLLQINKLSFKGVFSLHIYCIKYICTKSPDRVSIDRLNNYENYLYLFLRDVDGYIEKNNEINYLVFTSTEKNKKALKKYKKLQEETKKQIEVISDYEPIKYRNEFMKIRFESDDDLPLGKTSSISDMIIVAVFILESNGKYYPHFFT